MPRLVSPTLARKEKRAKEKRGKDAGFESE